MGVVSAEENSYLQWEFLTITRQEGMLFRSVLLGARYDVGYSFYTERMSDWNKLGGGNICFTSNPKWENHSDPNANELEIRLYKKRVGGHQIMKAFAQWEKIMAHKR